MKIIFVLLICFLIIGLSGIFYGVYLQMAERAECREADGIIVDTGETYCIDKKLFEGYEL